MAWEDDLMMPFEIKWVTNVYEGNLYRKCHLESLLFPETVFWYGLGWKGALKQYCFSPVRNGLGRWSDDALWN